MATIATVGIHLPQAGPVASGEAIREVAVRAEELGYADLWVSDHLVLPSNAKYPPSPYVYEPLVALTWAAAATSRIRLGTSVLVQSMRNPVEVAKAAATLDQLSGGRLTLGLGAGWLKAEFLAVGAPFPKRGARLNEAIQIMQTLWYQDNITAAFPVHGLEFNSIRAKPQPIGRIPIWIGGASDAALQRAAAYGDGWHGAFSSPEAALPIIRRLRRERPDPQFVISLRVRWDPLADSEESILTQLARFEDAGVQHFVAEPGQRTVEAYLQSVTSLARILEKA